MKKYVIGFILSIVSIGLAKAQFDAQFSQYMLHNSAFNPAAAGESGLIDIIGQHRIQWVGMPNGGTTTSFTMTSPLKIGNSLHGIGFSFLNDKAGSLFTNQAAHLQYTYKMKLGSGMLSLGTDVGFTSLGFNSDSIKNHLVTIGDYHDISSDPEIPTSSEVGMSLDMSLGVWYSTPRYYAGLSLQHFNNPVIEWGTKTKFTETRTMYLTGGYNWALPNPRYVVKPSVLFKSDFTSWQCDLSSRLEYNNKYWGGLTYRYGDAVVVLAGINIAGGLSIGYSYDLPVTQIITASSGSHEIVLFYSFEYVFEKKATKYKSIRIL